ncbi:hypothetical protein [uncultured Cellulomonas sp.]|uniref:fascin domain-containing protein n=1 Tax=uncultured Cellulomonas sp. TaxID=189682 RepID=UPI0026180786|nr:hypothetical protein [uncultured Cellulomonas sp.]
MFIQLKTYDGQHYVSADGGGGGGVNAIRTWPAQWETFRLVAAQGAELRSGVPVNIVTADGMHFLCAEGGGDREVVANRTVPSIWETFLIERVDGVADIASGCQVHFRVHDGHYICAEGAGGREVVANRSAAAQWETFTVTVLPAESLFPMRINGQSRLSRGKWVSADATLTRDGRLHTELHVWTRNESYGFHGACGVLVVDEANAVLWRSELHTLGVDGTWIPGKPSSRTSSYEEVVPTEIMAKMAAVRLLLVENPRNMLSHDLDEAVAVGKKIVDVGKVVAGIFALF